MDKPNVALSASRIKTAQSCSWLYWCKYNLKLPDSSNDGAKRGTVSHLVFEVLGEPKHKNHYDLIISHKDVFASEAIKRLIEKHARKLQVGDEDNIRQIKEMVLNGLQFDFFGDEAGKPDLAASEQEFDIVVNNDKIKYRIKGFIDKLFLYKDSSFALIRDFKTSKQKFKGKEISDNLQDYMYSLAVKHLFPEYVNRISQFLFLKFPLKNSDDSGILEMKPLDNDDLEGFEIQLSETQKYLDNFSEKDAISNLAARQPFPLDSSFSGPLQCGRSKIPNEIKKDGSVMWGCFCKFPFDYYHIYNSNGVFVSACLERDWKESLVPVGGSFEKKSYAGCPAFKKRS